MRCHPRYSKGMANRPLDERTDERTERNPEFPTLAEASRRRQLPASFPQRGVEATADAELRRERGTSHAAGASQAGEIEAEALNGGAACRRTWHRGSEWRVAKARSSRASLPARRAPRRVDRGAFG